MSQRSVGGFPAKRRESVGEGRAPRVCGAGRSGGAA